MASTLLEKIFRIKIQVIVRFSVNQISANLSKFTFYHPKILIVTINSFSTQLHQTKNLVDILKNYTSKKTIPYFCFAEDICIGTPNLILASGAKSYVSSMSFIGDYGFVWTSLTANKLMEKYQIRYSNVKASENSYKFNVLEGLDQNSQKWIKNHLISLREDLQNSILEQRKLKLNRKIPITQIKERLSKGLIRTQELLEYGLIDQIGTYEQFLENSFPGIKIYDILKINKQSKQLLSGVSDFY